jgi:hypothetical protein
MLRLSIFGWVGVAFVLVFVPGATSALGQVIPHPKEEPRTPPIDAPGNPRTCVVDVKVTDKCPEVQETNCPTGACAKTGLGCDTTDGKTISFERKLRNPGATVQAAREATAEEKKNSQAFQPNKPDSPVVCYEFRGCFCKSLAPMPGTRCVRGDLYQKTIYSWTASKDPCLVPVLIEIE